MKIGAIVLGAAALLCLAGGAPSRWLPCGATPACAGARDSLAAQEYANALNVVLPDPPDLSKLASRAARMYVDGLSTYYAYYASALKHRRELFDWQLYSSKVIFLIVVLLVVVGVIFAGIQFFREPVGSESSLEATLGGLKVSSRIVGVILLVISFMFFYMYLVYVYPIHEAISVVSK